MLRSNETNELVQYIYYTIMIHTLDICKFIEYNYNIMEFW